MRKKGSFKVREISPDPVYNSKLVAKFTNILMKNGKKAVAFNIICSVIKALSKDGVDGLAILEKACENVEPVLETKSKRVGGMIVQVPYEIGKKRRLFLAILWLIQAARERKGKSMVEKLVAEINDAYNEEGAAIEKKRIRHKNASSNNVLALSF